jgi:hypothetical protein
MPSYKPESWNPLGCLLPQKIETFIIVKSATGERRKCSRAAELKGLVREMSH